LVLHVIDSVPAITTIREVFQLVLMSGAQEQVITNEELLTGFSEHLRKQAKSKHTVRAYLADVRKLVRFFQNGNSEHLLTQTTPERVDAYVQHLEETTPSDSSVKRQVMGLRQFFSFLVRRRLIQTNPIRSVSVVHLPVDAIPVANLRRMFEHLYTRQTTERQDDTIRYVRDELMLLFMLVLGVRQYQLPLLRVSGMKKEDGAYQLTVAPNFIIKLDGVILGLLHNYLKTRQYGGDTIFAEPLTKRPISSASIHAVMTELTYAAGSPVTPKTIRHTFERFQTNPETANSLLEWIAQLHNGRMAE
jgi:integrase/recombinase XerD